MPKTLSAAQRKHLNAQYMPRQAVPNAETYLENAAKRSATARKKLKGHIDIAYGDTEGQTLDIFAASQPKAPVHVFIHGGYWRALDKSFYSEMATPFVKAGATVVLLNYDLAPKVSVTQIVAQMRRAMVWIYKNIKTYNGDRTNIHVSGHSAGGHLAAMLISTDWKAEAKIPNTLIKSSTLISGLYDLTDHRETEVQADIKLSAKEVKTMSPVRFPPVAKGPALVALGGAEPDLFHWQSLCYAAHLRLHHVSASVLEMPGDNHFDITDRLARASDPLTKAMLRLMALD